MADDVSVTFGADAGDLIEALAEIDADLKATVASLGQMASASGSAGAALSQMGSKGASASKQLAQATKDNQDTLKAATKEWQSAFAPIDRAFAQTVSGMVSGTHTVQQNIRSAVQSMLTSYIDLAEQSLSHWIASELAKTMATETGAAARSAAENSGQSTSLIGLIENALKAIGADAAKVFADVYAFFSPILGPAAAAPATAAAGAVTAVGSTLTGYAAGTWDVPQDMPAFIHKGEAILPADFASGFRAAMAGGGGGRGGSPSASFSIQAMDGASVQRVLGANHGAVAAALKRAWRHGSGSVK